MDANNWFNNYLSRPKLPYRQNDFGGTFGGPITIPGLYRGRDHTFFFFSYEGMRTTASKAASEMGVPSLDVRANAPSALRPFLNAFPLPTGANYTGSSAGLAQFISGYSAPSNLNTPSLRVDHHFSQNLNVFGRVSYSPSDSVTRYSQDYAQIRKARGDVRLVTLGATSTFRNNLSNELRFNYTQNDNKLSIYTDSFKGATPLDDSYLHSFPGMSSQASWLQVYTYGSFPGLQLIPTDASQRQWNITNTTSMQFGRHNWRWGIDWRRISNQQLMPTMFQQVGFSDEAHLLSGTPSSYNASINPVRMQPIYTNWSLFAQDEWHATQRLSLSLGLRWEINPPASDADGNDPYTVTSTNLATLDLAPKGTPLYQTTYNNLAPRIGIAYQLRNRPGAETVFRTGFGLFYDTGSSTNAGGVYAGLGYSASRSFTGSTFPLTQPQVDSITIQPVAKPYSGVTAYDPQFKLPRTWQWNAALQQALGSHQSITISYVAAYGDRLISSKTFNVASQGNTNFTSGNNVGLVFNGSSSSYNSLQLQFQRNLFRGLQSLLGYTWSHAIDDVSSNFSVYTQKRSSSDLDVRHNFQAALTYNIPSRFSSKTLEAVLGHWSSDLRVFARSALPVDVMGTYALDPTSGIFSHFHPNLNPGVPLYVYRSGVPGGRVINCLAFVSDCNNPTASLPTTEGNAPRNVARGFAAAEADVAIRREFPIHESLGLTFRAEAFNVFNHPVLGAISSRVTNTDFGRATNTLNESLGNLNSLYQVGGPRSLQVALRLHF